MQRRVLLVSIFAGGSGRKGACQSEILPRVTRPFKSPGGHPNALDAPPEDLWVGDEKVTDMAYVPDRKAGEVLKKVPAKSSNTSGMAYGGGYICIGANGGPILRQPRPDDPKYGRIVEVDVETRRTVAVCRIPDEGGLHTVPYADDLLWFTCSKWNAIARVDPDTLRVQHKILQHLTRPHGLAWDPPGIGVAYWARVPTNAMEMYQGKIDYCDAGISPGAAESKSPFAGYFYRIDS